MKKEDLLKEFYNQEFNPEKYHMKGFKDLTEDEKNKIEDTLLFEWFSLSHKFKELIKSFQIEVFIVYVFSITWFGFCLYLLYLGFRQFFNL